MAKKKMARATSKRSPKKTTRNAKPSKRRAAKSARKRASNAAFMRPMTRTAAVLTVMGSEPKPRTGVAKKLWAYTSSVSQLRNPRSGLFVMIDRDAGEIVGHKQSRGAYKGVPIARKSSKRS